MMLSGRFSLRVDFSGVMFNGRAVSTDVITGSAKAYLEALNRAMTREETAEEGQQNGAKGKAVAV